ncbi:hypothetical protein BZG36_01460 [Bifiguratus adelaidae]|uniref:Uncharacterized protein n=1 Tax=Bifiguratus adelaidae TaxID=1938954 RepID=A0A261Y500_9FUNG|nr:hypothetical protein BZG36_01460 [Bifiguratus adelaidae]
MESVRSDERMDRYGNKPLLWAQLPAPDFDLDALSTQQRPQSTSTPIPAVSITPFHSARALMMSADQGLMDRNGQITSPPKPRTEAYDMAGTYVSDDDYEVPCR